MIEGALDASKGHQVDNRFVLGIKFSNNIYKSGKNIWRIMVFELFSKDIQKTKIWVNHTFIEKQFLNSSNLV
jgi:hypothetical protein